MGIAETAEESQVPPWPELIVPVLQALEGGETLHRLDIFDQAADLAGLNESARKERLASGGLRYEQRMGWVLSNGLKADLVERPEKAFYVITDAGREWLTEHPAGLTYGEARRQFRHLWPKRTPKEDGTSADPIGDRTLDPIEQIEDAITRINSEVSEELLHRLRESHPDFFEQAVVDLLLAMGYGGAEQRGRRIGGSGDEGIDGIIDQDALGLDRIYIQAKRYAEGRNISREMIQAFVGALHGVGASRGVFITTSTFTPPAREYAAAVPSRLILIDSERLPDLMLKYGVGVQARRTYEVVEIDADYFE